MTFTLVMPAQHRYHYLALGQAITRPIPHNCLLYSHASKRFPGARTPLLHKWHNMLRDDLPGCHRYTLIMPSMVQLPAWVCDAWRKSHRAA